MVPFPRPRRAADASGSGAGNAEEAARQAALGGEPHDARIADLNGGFLELLTQLASFGLSAGAPPVLSGEPKQEQATS